MADFNFDYLGQNITLMMNQCLKSDYLCQYLYNDTDDPTATALPVPKNSLVNNKVFGMPFDEQVERQDCSHLCIYYSNGALMNDMVVTNAFVTFDIVVAKRLWMITDYDNSSNFRAYAIMREISKEFRGQSVDTVGKLLFTNFGQLNVNKDFSAIRLTAKMTGFSGGS